VAVTDDSAGEQDEDVTLTLSAISGAVAAATQQTFELGIAGDDAAATPGSPLDASAAWSHERWIVWSGSFR